MGKGFGEFGPAILCGSVRKGKKELKEVKGADVFKIAGDRVLVFCKDGRAVSVLQMMEGYKESSRLIRWGFSKAVDWALKKRPDCKLYVGVLKELKSLDEEGVCWYPEEDGFKHTKVYSPMTMDEAIHMGMKSRGLKLYKVV